MCLVHSDLRLCSEFDYVLDEVDPLLGSCGAELKIVSIITDLRVDDRLLRHLESPACKALDPFEPRPPPGVTGLPAREDPPGAPGRRSGSDPVCPRTICMCRESGFLRSPQWLFRVPSPLVPPKATTLGLFLPDRYTCRGKIRLLLRPLHDRNPYLYLSVHRE